MHIYFGPRSHLYGDLISNYPIEIWLYDLRGNWYFAHLESLEVNLIRSNVGECLSKLQFIFGDTKKRDDNNGIIVFKGSL